MKKIIIGILLIVVFVVSYFFILNKNIPANEKPMYGYANYEEYISNRTEEARLRDEKLLSSVSETIRNKSVEGVTNIKEATEHSCNLALTYYQKGDKKTAMKRYNQAWLIDHTHPCPFEGFALLK